MTMIKGNQQGGAPSLDNIDLTHATTLQCEACGCKGFKTTMILKKLSPLLSPTGQEAIIPIQAFGCENCGHINKEFEEAEVKQG